MIKGTESVKDQNIVYPCLMKSRYNETIMLMDSATSGMILTVGTREPDTNLYLENINIRDYTYYNDSYTLENLR